MQVHQSIMGPGVQIFPYLVHISHEISRMCSTRSAAGIHMRPITWYLKSMQEPLSVTSHQNQHHGQHLHNSSRVQRILPWETVLNVTKVMLRRIIQEETNSDWQYPCSFTSFHPCNSEIGKTPKPWSKIWWIHFSSSTHENTSQTPSSTWSWRWQLNCS